MNFSSSTNVTLDALDALSGHRVNRREDLGVLLELGSAEDTSPVLDDLAFRAKFLTRTFGIMRRIGSEGEGYERLESEFAAGMDIARGHLRALLKGAPGDVRERFDTAYLSMTPGGLGNLMELLGDLAWYKNWLLDTARGRS